MEELAGFWRRFWAEILDSLIVGTLFWLLFNLIFGLDEESLTNDIISTIIYILYATLLPVYWRGYIIGKRILKIHIERIDGEPLTLWTMIKREVIGKQLLNIATLGIAWIASALMVSLREDKRGFHDLIAGTHVVKD
ncbi:RDD family protein [Lysinibacillus fusiformis]|nr:RDD family protein [Lysinibacillus fusiformis]